MQTNCPNCNAQTSTLHTTCDFCKTMLRPKRVLSKEQEEELEKFAEAIELRFKSIAGNWDAPVMGGCLGGLLIITATWLGLYYAEMTMNFKVILGSTISITLFALWGGLVTWSEKKACQAAYDSQIKGDIEHFLEMRSFYRYEFDMVANGKLEENAFLRAFLFLKH